uniref:BTB domain-containing protein n=1 Tax=Schistocephalus solidus TaxID=70667 RepID=A0A0X3NI63_SCHSO
MMTTFQSPERISFKLLERERKRGRLCDFTLFVNGVRILAHKIVLAATIPFFRDVFLHGEESAEFEELKRLSPELIETIISFAYTGRIEVTEINLGDLLDASKKLGINSLREQCAEYITTRQPPNFNRGIMEFARKLAMEDIVEACLVGIAKAFDAYIGTEAVYRLEEREFCSLLTRSDLRIQGEASLHRGIVSWLEYRSTEAASRKSRWSSFACLASYPHLFGLICSLFLRADAAIQFMHTSQELTFRLSLENIVPYLCIAKELEFADVTALIEWALCKNFEEFAATMEFAELSCRQLKRLLVRDDLVVTSEVTVFRSLVTWLNAQKLDRAARQLMFEDLFALIRLLQVPANFLPSMLSEYSDCSASSKCQDLIQRAHHINNGSQTSIPEAKEMLTASFSRKPRTYRDSGRPVPFVLSELPFSSDQYVLVTYSMKQDAWNAVSRMSIRCNASVVGFGDFIYAFADEDRSRNWSVQIFTPNTGEYRQGSEVPAGDPCRWAIVLDKRIFVASTTKCSSLYDPLSDMWSEGPGFKNSLPISCLISVRERHVVALHTRGKNAKAFYWSTTLVETDHNGQPMQAKEWTDMPSPNFRPLVACGIELNGRIFLAAEGNQLAMFISKHDALPDAWIPVGQWTILSALHFEGYSLNFILTAGDIYVMGNGEVGPNYMENAAVFLPAVEDRRPGSVSQSSSANSMSSWRWWSLEKFPSWCAYKYGGVLFRNQSTKSN